MDGAGMIASFVSMSYHNNVVLDRIGSVETFTKIKVVVLVNNYVHVAMFGSGPFYQHGLTLIPAWICNHIHYKVWDEITYPFLNFNGATVEV